MRVTGTCRLSKQWTAPKTVEWLMKLITSTGARRWRQRPHRVATSKLEDVQVRKTVEWLMKLITSTGARRWRQRPRCVATSKLEDVQRSSTW